MGTLKKAQGQMQSCDRDAFGTDEARDRNMVLATSYPDHFPPWMGTGHRSSGSWEDEGCNCYTG